MSIFSKLIHIFIGIPIKIISLFDWGGTLTADSKNHTEMQRICHSIIFKIKNKVGELTPIITKDTIHLLVISKSNKLNSRMEHSPKSQSHVFRTNVHWKKQWPFQEKMLGEQDIYGQIILGRERLFHQTHVNSRWTSELTVTHRTIKLFEVNIIIHI